MTIDNLKSFLEEFGDDVKFSSDLKKKNWFNIGGKAKVFYNADNLNNLINFLKKINNQERIFILGAGSNTLITDNMFDGIVIKLGKNFRNISLLGEDIIIAGSAALDKSLSTFAAENSIAGFEFLSCIPGTIGGGIRMNAGCFNSEFKDLLVSVQAVDKFGSVKTISAKDIKFDYRKSNLPDDLIFLSASFKAIKGKINEIKDKIDKLKKEKEKNQPLKIKTSGSTFKNPISQTKKKVWELIKESVPLNKNLVTHIFQKNIVIFLLTKVMHRLMI